MNNIVIIGFGISSLCFLLYLYDNNLIKKFSSITILEKNNCPCFSTLNYNINSNSTLRSLISMFTNEIFKEIIEDINNTYNLDKFIPLHLYNKILIRLSNTFLKYIKKIPNIYTFFNYNVYKITTLLNDKLQINDDIITDKIILATGGNQSKEYLETLDTNNIIKNRDNIILPHEIFTTKSLEKYNNKNIIIIGSSHSIMSIIDILYHNKINFKKILIYHRRKIKVFYYNLEECLKNKDTCEINDICTETNFINRFDGLRENSKKIYLNINSDKRITFENNYKKINFDNYNYIIPCWGYYKLIPKIDNKLSFNIQSTNNYQLILNNDLKKNIFLLGIMSNPKVKITQKSFTKSIDGVWYYYNIISKHMYNLL